MIICTIIEWISLNISKGSELKKQVAKVLEEKVVWPWVSNDDDASGKRLEILKSGRKYTIM